MPLGELLEGLAEIVGVSNRTAEISGLLDHLGLALRDSAQLGLRDRLILALARGLRRVGGQLPVNQLKERPAAIIVSDLIQDSRTKAIDNLAQESARVEAVRRLSVLTPAESTKLLAELVEATQPVAVQIAAVRALIEDQGADVAAILLPRLQGFEPSVRAAAIQTLLARGNWAKALLQAIARNDLSRGMTPALVELADRAPLMKHRDVEIARLAQHLFSQVSSRPRAQVIREYVAALALKGDPARGSKIFERTCAGCHRVGDRGFAMGPDLTGSPSRDAATLVANILDPNATVVPGAVQYVVIDQDGRSYTGMITGETATSLTLRGAGGAEETILRSRIAELRSTGLSLMPEGLEKIISKPEMSDVVAFLRASHRGGEEDETSGKPQSLDIGTLPGLIEPGD